MTNEWGGAGIVAAPTKRPGAGGGVKIKVKLKKEKTDREKKAKKESKKDRKVSLALDMIPDLALLLCSLKCRSRNAIARKQSKAARLCC